MRMSSGKSGVPNLQGKVKVPPVSKLKLYHKIRNIVKDTHTHPPHKKKIYSHEFGKKRNIQKEKKGGWW